ncbi:SixA phosphatase family protein [Cognataquiflexum rubidum]|uniref:SixA phosphatase family protein n=1 Tax=Cognataquiflexum rubidum TaxID=2922273 RepID=UPI001F12C393|nr:histidine phosphatase family protein [Cognataquiflexum rubidum]MCH6233578.1 histidine phosphatase family protein [Cognataquiflexum rubidum]
MALSKFLYLLRHGQAEPGIGPIGDLKRPLTEIGMSRIKQVSQVLATREITFDLILASPAVRTSQTSKIISNAVFSKERLEVDEIYDAEVNDLLKTVYKVNSDVRNLLIVGHNPSLSSLVMLLTGNDSVNLHPGMLAIIEIEVEDWNHIGRNTGILKEVI